MTASVFSVLVLLVFLMGPSGAKDSAPKVQVYTRAPGEFGKANNLICHVSGFHPPEISIELLRNGQEIPDSKQTDLAFEENWHYHMTKHVTFTPNKGEDFRCRVTHLGKKNDYAWEPDM